MTQPTPLILDVDTGIDDALALALAVRSAAAELVAVTTLAGNVGVERTTANTLAVLDWLDASDIPVHRGASRPLVRSHRNAAYFHDADGLGGATLPPSRRTVGTDRGPAAIIRLARSRPAELTLVCVGPLTNLAIALNVEPELPALLRRVIVMGGAFAVPGNVTPAAEFNVFADPEAAAQVFAASLPGLIAIGLDVTQRTALPRSIWEAAARTRSGDAASGLVARVCRRAFVERGLDSIYLHDPLAVAVALDPSLVTAAAVEVQVGFDGEQAGATRPGGPGPVRVATGVDAERFLDGFVDALSLPVPDEARQG
jgi:inosine-uridine nucleoside N-ribohydrolase